MNFKHRRTLQRIYARPIQSSIHWVDIEALLISLDAEITEGRGSRVRIALSDVRAVFHRPHPKKETDRGAVVAMRRFLQTAGINP